MKLPPGFVLPSVMSLCSNIQYESPQSHFKSTPCFYPELYMEPFIFFPKAGQNLFFLRKSKRRKNYETVKNCNL